MSIVSKLIIVIIIFISIIIGIWLVFRPSAIKNPITNIPQNQNTQVIQSNNNLELIISPKDVSNAALSSDFYLINNEIQNLNIDLAGVDVAIAQMLEVTANITGFSIATIIKQADGEIDQRVKNLNDLLARIRSMKKITIIQQDSLILVVNNEINELNTLKAKIDSDTSTPTAISDYQTITDLYNVYDLWFAKIRMITATDKILIIAGYMNTVGKKVQTRISTLTGVNNAPIIQIFSIFSSKVSNASAQAKTVSNELFGLKLDQGEQVKMSASVAMLNDARLKLKTASDSLFASRDNIGTIIDYLKR